MTKSIKVWAKKLVKDEHDKRHKECSATSVTQDLQEELTNWTNFISNYDPEKQEYHLKNFSEVILLLSYINSKLYHRQQNAPIHQLCLHALHFLELRPQI